MALFLCSGFFQKPRMRQNKKCQNCRLRCRDVKWIKTRGTTSSVRLLQENAFRATLRKCFVYRSTRTTLPITWPMAIRPTMLKLKMNFSLIHRLKTWDLVEVWRIQCILAPTKNTSNVQCAMQLSTTSNSWRDILQPFRCELFPSIKVLAWRDTWHTIPTDCLLWFVVHSILQPEEARTLHYIHTDERPFKCLVCNATFRAHRDLKTTFSATGGRGHSNVNTAIKRTIGDRR